VKGTNARYRKRKTFSWSITFRGNSNEREATRFDALSNINGRVKKRESPKKRMNKTI